MILLELICDLKKSQVSVGYLILLLNEYGPVNNRFFMDILPKYVASFFGNCGTPFFNLWRHHPIKASSTEDWFYLFLDISFFHINFVLKPYGYYFLL